MQTKLFFIYVFSFWIFAFHIVLLFEGPFIQILNVFNTDIFKFP